MPSKSGRARRSVSLGFAVVLLALGLQPAAPAARSDSSDGLFFVAGRNVNTIGMPPAPGAGNPNFTGDPLFKQQNEVDCDVSPNDSRLVFCANNDYRGIEAFGDSWIGVTISDDGGLTWKSRLHPGFPAPGAQIGAADPVVSTVPGLGLVGYITISRSDNRGTLSLGRWLERNKENGDRYTPLDRVVIGSGTPGRFADKPAMVVVLTPDGLAGGVTTVGDPAVPDLHRDVPNGVIHFGYAIFPGNTNNSSSEIYHLMSADYGRTWSNPKKLSESLGINQGIDFAVAGSTVVATWRRIKDNNEPDAIMFARSADGGKTWSKAAVLSLGTFFDQDSSDLQFRTRSMPSIVHDGTSFHVFWAERGRSASPLDTLKVDARVVVASSTNGTSWPASPTVVDNHSGRGHQLMPTAAVAGGRVQVNWIDSRNNTREDSFRATLNDYDYYDDKDTDAEGKPRRFVYRQAVDVFAAQAPSATSLAFGGAKQVSRYRTALIPGTTVRAPVEYNFINARMFRQGSWPFHGDYHTVASRRYVPNPDPAAATTVPWVANTAALDSNAVFYSAFTDNRDVRGYVWAGPANSSFTPSGVTAQGESGAEVPGPVNCSAGVQDPLGSYFWSTENSPRSRDQNVYAAATLPGLLVESASGSKPTVTTTGAGTVAVKRAYVVTVYNLTPRPLPRNYRLTIATQAGSSVSASWSRCEAGAPCVPLTTLDAPIGALSSITRTVYLSSSDANPWPRVVVNVDEIGGDGQKGAVILNANPNALEIDQPDGVVTSILTQEVYQPDIPGRQTTIYTSDLANPEVVPVSELMTPRIEYPRIEYPRIEYPRIEYTTPENPRIEYPRIEYIAPETPRIEYPRIEYPRIEYKAIENPRIEYPRIEYSALITEITWPVTTDGANTTTAMTAKVFVNGGLSEGMQAQLLVTVPYQAGVANSCAPGDTGPIVDNQVIVNSFVNPADLAATLDPPDVVNPPSWQPSFPVKPGQTVWVTLRIRGVMDTNLARRAGLWVRSQPDTVADNALDEAKDGTIDLTAPRFSTPGEVLGTGEATGPGGGVVTYNLPAVTDAVDAAPVVVCEPASGSSFPLGESTVTCTATDASLNSTRAAFKVVVVDTRPPTFPTAGGALALPTEATGPNGATVIYALPPATDIVDASPTVSCSPASGSTFAVGTTSVMCTATDGSGNSASATFTVRVVDTRPPVLTALTNVTADSTSAAGAVVLYAAPAAIDLVDASPSVVCTPVSGSTFPVGTTTVTCVATDASGNSTSTQFIVTVSDVTPPVIDETATPNVLIWSPNKIMTPVKVEGTITDASTVTATYSIVDEYGTYSKSNVPITAVNGTYSFTVNLEAWRKGTDSDGRTYTITVTATDIKGNAASKSVVVKVPHNS